MREKDCLQKKKQRKERTEAQKEMDRIKDKANKANKRSSMTVEEKERIKEKDRLRKAAKRAEAKKIEETSGIIKVDRRTIIGEQNYLKNERENNRKYKEKMRKGQTEGEAEFERIENLLYKRNSRVDRSEAQKEADKKRACEDMKLERILPFKKRNPYGQSEEFMWWKFWKKNTENRKLLKKLLPDYHKKFKGWEAKSENPFSIEEKEEEKRATMTVREKLDEKNRKRKLEREMLRQELQKPIDMPEIEMSEYEILREKNIAEMKQFMRDSGLFDD